MKKHLALTSLLFLPVLLLCGCNEKPESGASQGDLTPAEVQVLAKEAYVYGFPMVMNYKTMWNYVLDKDSPNTRGPSTDSLRGAPLHSGGQGGRHPQCRHALLHVLDGPPRRAAGPERAGDGAGPVLPLPAHRPLHPQLRLRRHADHRQRRREVPDRRARTGTARSRRGSRR